MFPISIDYTLSMRDFREANYFGTIQRYRTSFRILLWLLIATVFYSMVVAMGLIPLVAPILFIPAAYVIWAIFVFAGVERRIRGYIKSQDCMIGKKFHVVFTENRMELEIPELKTKSHCVISQLTLVMEITDLYMLYLDGEKTYLVPTRGLTAEQRTTMRMNFKKRLANRFYTVVKQRK